MSDTTKRIESLSIGDGTLSGYDLLCRKKIQGKSVPANVNVVAVVEIYSDGYATIRGTFKGIEMSSRFQTQRFNYPFKFSEITYMNVNGNNQAVGGYRGGSSTAGISTLIYNPHLNTHTEDNIKSFMYVSCERLWDVSTYAKFDVYFETCGYVDLTNSSVQDFIEE
jgi:hypothetical protein